MSDGYKPFVINIKRISKEKNLTQKELSQITGIGEKSMSRYFTGASSPNLLSLVAIADALGVSCDELLGRNDVDATIRQAIQNEDIKHIVLELDKDPELLEKFKKMFS